MQNSGKLTVIHYFDDKSTIAQKDDNAGRKDSLQ